MMERGSIQLNEGRDYIYACGYLYYFLEGFFCLSLKKNFERRFDRRECVAGSRYRIGLVSGNSLILGVGGEICRVIKI